MLTLPPSSVVITPADAAIIDVLWADKLRHLKAAGIELKPHQRSLVAQIRTMANAARAAAGTPEPIAEDRWLPLKDVASRCGVSVEAARKWAVADARFTWVQVRRQWFALEADVAMYSNRNQPALQPRNAVSR